jgi:hypothetical protein
MSLALPALLVLFLALPGILFYSGYSGGFRQRAASIISTPGSVTWSLTIALVSSVALHALWSAFAWGWFDETVDLGTVLYLLGGQYSGQDVYVKALNTVAARPYLTVTYFLSLYVFSALLGVAIRRFVRRNYLDKKFLFLRLNNEWHYLFSGELAGDAGGDKFAIISTTIEHQDGTFLYVGILHHYQMNDSGSLDWIALASPTYRRKLADDFMGSRSDHEHITLDGRYYEVRGEYLVLATQNIKTMNIDYFYVTEASESVPAEIEPSNSLAGPS